MRWNTYIVRKILEAGGYGMLYNWFCTQQQASVEYGYLYNWYSATDSRNICSVGFHVPTSTEIAILRTYLSPNPSLKLKEVGLIHWNSPNTGATNESGFNGRGSGERIFNTGSFSNIKSYFYLWESTGTCNYSRIDYSSGDFIAYSSSTLGRTKGLSIRPMKDSTTLTHGQTGTYVDPSGIIYPTICIGTQEWVACNIMTKHYRNGDAIPEVTDNTAWSALTTGARCSYNNTEANAGSTKKISSSDNFIMSLDLHYENLVDYCGASGNYTNTNNVIGNLNLSGFNLKKAGFRVPSGDFVSFNEGCFLLSNFQSSIHKWVNYPSYPNAFYLGNDPISNSGNLGYSLRLCNPATTHADGYVGSYTQNDGTIIPTIVINGVEWTMNLRETKWSDGSYIQNITDNAAWSLLKEAACCDINNDPTKR